MSLVTSKKKNNVEQGGIVLHRRNSRKVSLKSQSRPQQQSNYHKNDVAPHFHGQPLQRNHFHAQCPRALSQAYFIIFAGEREPAQGEIVGNACAMVCHITNILISLMVPQIST